MLAKSVPELPVGPGMTYEPKWDGYRCIIFRDGGEVELASRGGKTLTRYFPEVVEQALAQLPERCAIDGELVVIRRDGGATPRLDFDLLGQRIHPAASRVRMLAGRTPASFIAFDLLVLGDEALTDRPYPERRARLEAALAGVRPPTYVTPITTDLDTARRWFEVFEGAGLDGVVAKPADLRYEPGKRLMFKVKHTRTADVVVAGFRYHTSGPIVGSLLLGLYDAEGRLHHVGVSASFTAKRRAELLDDIAPYQERAAEGHPWLPAGGGEHPGGTAPGGIPSGDTAATTPGKPAAGTVAPTGGGPAPGGGAAAASSGQPEAAAPTGGGPARIPGAPSRWTGKKDLTWHPLRPEWVIEVGYDAMEGDRFRHTAQFKRSRPDREPRSCTYDQLDRPLRFDVDAVLANGA